MANSPIIKRNDSESRYMSYVVDLVDLVGSSRFRDFVWYVDRNWCGWARGEPFVKASL